jgi:hypothetical protein
MIPKELAFRREPSGTVTVPGANSPEESCPAGLLAIAGLRWWRQSPSQPNGGFREIDRYPTAAAGSRFATRRRCPETAVTVLTTPYRLDTEYEECSRNYFSDPDEWAALFKVAGDDAS